MNYTSTYPSKSDADVILKWAGDMNPGAWVDHSRNTARAAEKIASMCGLDSEKAYSLGMLHEVGRYESRRDLHHVIAGYKMLRDNYSDAARICVTSAFVVPDINNRTERNDCTSEETQFIRSFLKSVEYDDYDRLIQLCTVMASSDGVGMLEKKLSDEALKNGLNTYSLENWRKLFEIKKGFDDKCGGIYDLFRDEIIKTSIGIQG
ncbi:MAG: HD domain-containing protein [Oscillospiraceae bacterium]|jgi:hypothetical protein